MARSTDLTKGNITRGLWGFALPLMLGNVISVYDEPTAASALSPTYRPTTHVSTRL